TSLEGGMSGVGTVFRLSTNGGGYSTLHSFADGGDGRSAFAGLVQASDGALYGTTAKGSLVFGTLFRLNAHGGNYSGLHHFTASSGDGAGPLAELIQLSDGKLYGTTLNGGTNRLGTIFRLDTNGENYSVLYSFAGAGGDGGGPSAKLIQGIDGALYGTTKI